MSPEEKNKACANYQGDYGMTVHGLSACPGCGFYHHCCDVRYTCVPGHRRKGQ